MKKTLLAALTLLGLGVGIWALQLPASAHESVEHAMQDALSEGRIPSDLVITYDDMHSFHGGTTIQVYADGRAARRDLYQGKESSAELRLSAEDVKRLLDLVVELKSWEQKTEERLMVPGESQAKLLIRAGGLEGGFWEFYNDMESNQRLIQIKKLMEEMVPKGQ